MSEWRCNQICKWNSPVNGCIRPHSESCILANIDAGTADQKPLTNADRIRAMSDGELAEFLNRVHDFPCETCCGNLYWCRRNNAPEPICQNHFLDWLQQPAEEGDNG